MKGNIMKQLVEKPNRKVKIGDYVRSYDFERNFPEAEGCYVEGWVVDIVPFNSCDHYKIETNIRYFNDEMHEGEDHYFPPVNGVYQLFSENLTNYVIVLIEEEV